MQDIGSENRLISIKKEENFINSPPFIYSIVNSIHLDVKSC